MALNKYMHPRNIYKTPPNFKQLALDYPEFAKHTKQDVVGKISIDFKDVNALRALSATLLKKDFGLSVDIPVSRMIPTIPLRLNYILWLEDLLSINPRGEEEITGIDIGTGAACIYPLLAAKKNAWKMIATDVDPESVKSATDNVMRNAMEMLITVKKVADATILKEAIGSDLTADFSMCNPPFFASTQELNPLFKARRPDRPRPRNAFCATTTEAVAEGGEVTFIKRMIDESKTLQKRVRIYTTMIGHKSSLPALKDYLREAQVVSFKQTEFCQGHTTRWGLAWTYHNIDLRTIPQATVTVAKKSKPFQYSIKDCAWTFPDLTAKVTSAFDVLKLSYNLMKETKTYVCYSIMASADTWSNQRRKRREQQRINAVLSNNNPDLSKLQITSEEVVMEPDSLKSPKRELDDDGFYSCKKAKVSEIDETACYLKGLFIIKKADPDYVFELLFEEGTAGKDGLHQILQYIKNVLKLKIE